MVEAALFALGLAFALPATAQTSIDHQQIAYFVPEKRVNLAANVADPKGVKVARAYFKSAGQADYTFVPMQSAGANRYVATLPAPSANTPSIEYVILAQNNEGAVSRTAAYTVQARKSNETPAWQTSGQQGNVKVYTELAEAPKAVAGFSDSVTIDIIESGARLGAAGGLYASTGAAGGGAAGGAASASGAAAGGLSTMAIVGGVAVAGLAAAAAGGGGGGGGGGGSGSGTTGGTPGGAFGGQWSGTVTQAINMTCVVSGTSGTEVCNVSQPFTGTVDSAGNFNYTTQAATMSCNFFGSTTNQTVPAGSGTFPVPSSGVVSIPGRTDTQGGITTTCPTGSITFTSSPKRISGSYSCTTSGSPTPGATCNGSSTNTWSGS